MRLEGKVALITGATGGMGSASARLFAKKGAAVLVAARHQGQGDALVKEITDAGGKSDLRPPGHDGVRPVGRCRATGQEGVRRPSRPDELEGLSRHAAYVLADWGIRSNVIQPGFIETKMTAAIQSNPLVKRMAKKQMEDQVLLRREGKADEIGYTALFLASDESSYITGTDIVVDGGWVTAAPYLSADRRHHMLQILQTKEAVKEKKEAVEEFFRRHL
jgi:NAD(P)-dependent dehydrogenase (short-subunit alcohol dehydrogenase family)